MIVTKAENAKVIRETWGQLTWYLSEQESDDAEMTVGKCTIQPHCANPRHFHPNCQEILHVVKGKIEHSFETQHVMLEAGDTILIPAGVIHNAKNRSDETAEMMITFSSPNRQTTTAIESAEGESHADSVD